MKILIIEDDALIAEVLQTLFSSSHYAVDITATGEAGLEMAEAFDYELVLLDIGLPGLDGVSVCRQFRDRGFKMPILLLTALNDIQQKATALNAGADDYVVKPFDAEELMARVRALLRRGEMQTQPILTWGILSVDSRSFSVTYGSYPLSLTPKEFGLLEHLLRNPQQVFNARALLDRVWHAADAPGEEAVRVHIKQLRKKLVAAGAPKDLIETVHRLGYRLNPAYGAVSVAASDESAGAPMAELSVANEALQTELTTSPVTQAALSQQNQAWMATQSQIKAAYQQLLTSKADRERQVAELTTALAAAQRQLQQRDAGVRSPNLSLQARQIAHDMNNVFTPIEPI